MKSPRNANMERILQMAGIFSPAWRISIEAATTDEMKDAVDSILSNRDNIAHGGDVGLTIGTMKRYYGDALRVLELVENVVLA